PVVPYSSSPHKIVMAEILTNFPSEVYSEAEFWWKSDKDGIRFGVDVDDREKHMKMEYVADREIVPLGTPIPSVPVGKVPLETSAVGQESKYRMRGKLYYLGIPDPIPNGPATARVPPKTGDSPLYVVFEKGEGNTIAIVCLIRQY
ncbi:unnamed protein product, partial [Rhizoctonia solani]